MNIMMNEYYTHKKYGLVRTIARASETNGTGVKIMFCGVRPGGLASDFLLEDEASFLRNIKL